MNGRRSVVIVLALTIAGLLPSTASHADEVDNRPPTVIVTTPDGATIDGPGSVGGGRIAGEASDDSSGINEVRVRYLHSMDGVVLWGESTTVLLDCRSALDCDWSALPPRLPGCYEVQAMATDKAGNHSRFTESVRVTVTTLGFVTLGSCPP